MKKQYDFSKAEQDKIYRPIEKLGIPVYLDRVVNAVLKKDMEMFKAIES